MKDKDPKLNERQEALLSRYFDGECGVIQRLMAKRLLAQNLLARDFLRVLENNRSLHQQAKALDSDSIDLWARIDARIEQETKAAFYLGHRRVEAAPSSAFYTRRPAHALLGGLSGAAVAAIMLVVLYNNPREIISFSAPHSSSLQRQGVFQPVGLGNSRSSASSHAFAGASDPALKFDWMRANGSLALIPDPNGSSAIIWVRRKKLPAQSNHVGALLHPTPALTAQPGHGTPSVREWLDGSTVSVAK